MKSKLIITALMVLSSLSASARIWLGGEMALKTSSTSRASYLLGSGTWFEISPEVGYYISPKWSVALRIGYAHTSDSEVQLIDQKMYGTYNQVSVSSFVRYTYYRTGKFSFFADAAVGYSFLKKVYTDPTLQCISIGVRPGLAFAISPRVGLTGHLGSIGYDHQWMREKGQTLTNDTFHFNIFSSISFGAYVNF